MNRSFFTDISFCDEIPEEVIEKCEKQNCRHEDCFNRFFSLSRITDMNYSRKLATEFSIVFSGEPDIIFINQSQQKFIEFLCYIAGIISMWFGVSVLFFYDFLKQIMNYIIGLELGVFDIFRSSSAAQPQAFIPTPQRIRR
jgi:hypothetical protein